MFVRCSMERMECRIRSPQFLSFFLSFFLVTIVRRKVISAFMSSVRTSKIHHRIPSYGQMRHADPDSLPSPIFTVPYMVTPRCGDLFTNKQTTGKRLIFRDPVRQSYWATRRIRKAGDICMSLPSWDREREYCSLPVRSLETHHHLRRQRGRFSLAS